jgi:Uma2 family endonuclease
VRLDLDWESTQQERHKYLGGQFYAMSGARLNHNRIAVNAVTSVRQALRGLPCEAFMSEVKLQIDCAQDFYYPDVNVTCEARDLAEGRALAVQHPWLVVKVLSDSTAAVDRGSKFEHYRLIPLLTYHLLAETARPHAELFCRNAQGLGALHALGRATRSASRSPMSSTGR